MYGSSMARCRDSLFPLRVAAVFFVSASGACSPRAPACPILDADFSRAMLQCQSDSGFPPLAPVAVLAASGTAPGACTQASYSACDSWAALLTDTSTPTSICVVEQSGLPRCALASVCVGTDAGVTCFCGCGPECAPGFVCVKVGRDGGIENAFCQRVPCST